MVVQYEEILKHIVDISNLLEVELEQNCDR